ncbi:hypothetical protein GSI_11387 [Ganoderma sinense ZZ0214-1]|uniref:Uncharacterized protein n=1 Tax=Ganoderma sinense ZZ0214-1 TaxID=1077348 RepID=A0A2G8RWD2_9APHY|nr:hypothetical protein GSI_11387 [Ganoderma sinense ZZ0214-1]
MFRLPTHLESLVPPPGEQVPQTQPWRGRIFTPSGFPDPATQSCEIRVTAAETEYDNQQELWPEYFELQVIRRRGALSELHGWLARHAGQYPRCMLMPDRLPEQAASRRNHALFEDFARRLLEEEIVAISPWGYSGTLQHGGILLYPTTASRALLVGIVFLNTGFPDFVGAPGSGPSRFPPFSPASGSLLPRSQPFQPVMHHSPFDPAPPNISSSSRYTGYDMARGRSGRSSG